MMTRGVKVHNAIDSICKEHGVCNSTNDTQMMDLDELEKLLECPVKQFDSNVLACLPIGTIIGGEISDLVLLKS